MKKLFLALGLMVMSAVAIGYALPAGYVDVPNPEKVLDREMTPGEKIQVMENKATGGQIIVDISEWEKEEGEEDKVRALDVVQNLGSILQCNDDDYDVDGDDDEASISNCILDGKKFHQIVISRKYALISVEINEKVTKDELEVVLKDIRSKHKK